MQEQIYFVSFANPKTNEVLFAPKAGQAIQFRGVSEPQIGSSLLLNLSYRTSERFRVINVERVVEFDSPTIDSLGTPIVKEARVVWVTVVPLARDFIRVISSMKRHHARIIKKAVKQTK